MLSNVKSTNCELDIKEEKLDSGKFFNGILLVSLVIFLFLAVFLSVNKSSHFPEAIFILFINACLSIYGQLKSVKVHSPLHYISFLFCYLFMSIMPIMQIGYKIDPVLLNEDIVLLSSLAALLFTFLGFTSIIIINNSSNIIIETKRNNDFKYQYFLLSLVILFFSLIAIIVFKQSLFSTRQEFSRALASVFTDRATAGFVLNFLFLAPFFGAVIGLRSAITKRKKIWTVIFFLLFLISCAINNPMVNARYRVSGLAFFFIDYFFKGKKTKLLIVLLIIGISLAPLFQIFRYQTKNVDDAYDEVNYGEKFLSTDYDAFQMMGYTFLCIEKNDFSWGSNIVGSLLFFVPRAWWTEKPRPTSLMVYNTAVKYRKVGTDNLSVPLMAEGYFAFGWIGVLFISLIYWVGITIITHKSRKDSNSMIFLFRCICTGTVLIFLRGPLITSVTNVVGGFSAGLLVWGIFHLNFSKRLPDPPPNYTNLGKKE